ncbi:MAG: ParB/RepB/Spo0J family partition protein [Clostridiales bacterium]|nr:ParB/RepB/Spo0J family partition protein [Clostridiales bacterium]
MKKTGLGRGLDALLPEDNDLQNTVSMIAITELDRNPEQPRREFDEEALQALAESMKEAGVLQPLLVIERGGRYQIVAGERRFRAARLAGLTSVPCIVRDFTPQEQMEAALIENIQREDLNAIEEAAAVRQLMDRCGYTQEKAAKRLGKSRPAVANLLRLLSLPEAVKAQVTAGKLSAGHARVLAGLEDEKLQHALAERTVQEGLSVRALEKLAAQPAPMPRAKPEPRPLPLELQDMESRLRDAFGVRTQIRGNRKHGKIILQYYNEDELERLYQCMEALEGKG